MSCILINYKTQYKNDPADQTWSLKNKLHSYRLEMFFFSVKLIRHLWDSQRDFTDKARQYSASFQIPLDVGYVATGTRHLTFKLID